MTWILAFIGFSVLILLHEAGHMLAAKAVGMKVDKFYLFFGPPIVKFQRGETEYGIGTIPLGGYCAIAGFSEQQITEMDAQDHPRAYLRKKVWQRIFVILAGPLVNIAIAAGLLFYVGFQQQGYTNVVDKTVASAPAAKAGLQAGDKIISVNGKAVADGEALLNALACKTACKLELGIKRADSNKTLQVVSAKNASGDYKIGISPRYAKRDVSSGESAAYTWDTMSLVTSKTFHTFTHIFEAEQRKQLSGVVGGYRATEEAIDFSLPVALLVLALISLSLGLINLLPLLPLDGGHIWWAIVEKLRGSPAPASVVATASIVGFVLVAALFFLGLSNDIANLGQSALR